MPRLRKILICLFLLSILCVFTFDAGLTAQTQEVVNKDKKPLKELVKKATPEADVEKEGDKGYLYDPTGKTDPFRSFIAIREEKEEKEKKKPRTYLETLELSQLNLVVIVISPKEKWAMVKDSKDVGHVIKEGTAIGTNGGVVYKIQEGEVVIREEYKDFKGKKQYREIVKRTPGLR